MAKLITLISAMNIFWFNVTQDYRVQMGYHVL